MLWAGDRYLWPAHGVRDVYVGRCDARTSIVVKSSAYSHPLDFKFGDATGYGLFLRTSDRPRDISLYDDAFSEGDYRSGFPATYVGWNLAGSGWHKDPGKYVGPAPTNEFAPVPSGLSASQVRIFELPSGLYNRDTNRQPLLMNIFLPPDKVDTAQFNGIADCLDLHVADINRALVGVRADFPYRSQKFYEPLQLGAVVRGVPPWSDPNFANQIRALYGDTTSVKALPAAGFFTLYKGQNAIGIIDGKQVQISILPTGETQWTIDGTTLPDEPRPKDLAASGLRNVRGSSYGLMIGQSICHADKMDECAKQIERRFWNNDGSTTFWVTLKAADHSWVSEVAGLEAWRN